MPITYVGGQVSGRAGATTTPSTNFALTGGLAAVPAAGDLVIITAVVGSQARNPAQAISGYTALGQLNPNTQTYDTSLNVSWKRMGSTPDTAFTLPSTGNNQDAQSYTVQVFRGVDPTTPFDGVTPVTASGTGTTRANPGQITPNTAGAWIVVCSGGAAAAASAYTYSGLTAVLSRADADTNDSVVGSGYYSSWSSGAYDPAASTTGDATATSSWAAYTLALKPEPNAYTLTAQAGSYSLTGQSATITRNRALTASAGSYAVTGQSATLVKGRVLTAQAGSYSLTGQSANIDYAAVTGYTLTAQAGSYSLTGQSAGINVGKVLAAQAGSYSLTGQSADVAIGRVLTAQAGSYTIAGQAATIDYSGGVSLGGYFIVRRRRL